MNASLVRTGRGRCSRPFPVSFARTTSETGFTLVGLLVVVLTLAILAILATIAAFVVDTTASHPRRVSAVRTSAAFASCKSTVETVKTALAAYHAQTVTETYPVTITRLLATTAGNGPLLKQAPNESATPTALKKYGWALVTYHDARGTFEVETLHGATRRTGTPKVCKGA